MRIDPEFQALIPPLSDDEYAALELSIIAEGCRDDIVVWQHDGDDIIVDGHNRYAICTAAGLPYKTVTRDFSSRSEVMLWMIRNQLARRNLTPFKRTELALRMEAVIAEQARHNSLANLRNSPLDVLHKGHREAGRTEDRIGRTADVAGDTVRKVKKVLDSELAPIVNKARAGDISIRAAERMAEALHGQPEDVVELALRLADDSADKVAILARLYKSNGKDGSNATFDEIATNGGFHYGDEMDEWCDFAASSARQIDDALESLKKYHQAIEKAVNIERRIEHATELANQSKPMPEREYMFIYADPPWRYDFSATNNREIENHYPTMSIEDICALKPPAAQDCVLFMWATNPKLSEAFQVIEAWGFEYVTNMVWVKDKIGMGYYARQQHELLLIAKRGNGPVPEPANRPPSVIEATRGIHSRKPEQMYDILDRMYPGLPKIELFSRTPRKGWDSWGYEADEQL